MSFLARPAKITLAFVGLIFCLTVASICSHVWALGQFREGERLTAGQEYTQAYPHFVNALKVWRRSPEKELLAGRAARRGLMYAAAESHYQRCVALRGSDKAISTGVALERVLVQVQNGELRESEVILWDKVKGNDPEALLILEAMARGYTRMFRLGPAMHCLDLILERDPDNFEALFNRGSIAEGTTGTHEAIKDFRRALFLRPDRDDVRIRLARLVLMDNPKKAVELLEPVLNRCRENKDLLLELGNAYISAGDLDEGRALMEEVLERDPNNCRALSEKASLLIANGKQAEGEALLRLAIANDSSNVDVQYRLYLCLCGQPGRELERDAQRETYSRLAADRNRLAEILGKDMSKSPFDANLHYELGMIYFRGGKTDIGLRWLKSAFMLDANHIPTRKALAEYYERVGDPENAERFRGSLTSK